MNLDFKSNRRDLLKFLAIAAPVGVAAVQESKANEVEGSIILPSATPLLRKGDMLQSFCYFNSIYVERDFILRGFDLTVEGKRVCSITPYPQAFCKAGDKISVILSGMRKT